MTSGPRTPLAAPAVSIVMPCYNAMQTIEASIESVLAQSMDDWELLIVDDGSTDSSWHLITDIAGTDPRIKVVSQRNAGPSAARNLGVSRARGRIIAFLDSDDIWQPGHLATHCRKLGETSDLGISFSASLFIDEAGNRTGEGTRIPSRPLEIGDLLAGNPTGTCSALVFKRDVYETAGPMRSDMVHAEDQEWLIRVLHAGWRIECAPETPILYRISRYSLSSSVDKMLEGWHCVIEHARERFPEQVEREGTRALARMHLYFARRSVRSMRDRHAGFQHISTALSRDPRLPLHSPGNLLATIAVCAFPDTTRNFRSLISGNRHV